MKAAFLCAFILSGVFVYKLPQFKALQLRQLTHPADAFYSDLPLGAIYAVEATTFRVFAPTASRLELRLYERPAGGIARVYSMKRNPDGTWEAIVKGDCAELYYTYVASGDDPGFDPERELIDPYAKAVTAYNGRAIVVTDRTEVADRPQFPIERAVIYELHIRDYTIDPDSGVQRRGKYLGFTEAGTHLYGREDISTGLDHLTDLGVNVVQVMPVMEFMSDEAHDQYGWGYDSVHFNTPDGWYATERHTTARVKELKLMIDALHKRGIRVVLDAVYNHTMETQRQRVLSFEGLVPGYYYRRRPDGSFYNGSGVGNEFRSEAPMARRFILDSVKMWVEEYKVDGFRFDLMGLMDLETMEQIVRELRAIDPKLLIYGEPWAAGETPIQVTSKGRQKGFAVFNDNFRDALKGSVFEPKEQGFVQSGKHADAVKKGVMGSIDDFTNSPLETINYVECHDNHTFRDRLYTSTFYESSVTDADRRAMNRLGAAVIFTSQGIPFFQCGQEFLRSKGGDENSYNKTDSVNAVRWVEKAANYDIYSYYRGLIALRKAHPLFSYSSAQAVRKAVKFLDTAPKCVAFTVEDVEGQDGWKRALVVYNAAAQTVRLKIPEGEWRLYVDGLRAGVLEIERSRVKLEDEVLEVPGRSAVVLGERR